MKIVITAAALCLLVIPLSAREDSARALAGATFVNSHGTSVNVYPFAYYNPELKLALGAGGIITFYTSEDMILRPSKISVSGFYSTNNQYSISLGPQIYFRKNLLFISSQLRYGDKIYYMPDENNPELDATIYGVEIEMRLGKSPHVKDPLQLSDLTQLAFILDYDHVRMRNEPGYADLPPHNFGLGLARIWDNRDNIFNPLKGHLIRLEALFYMKAIGGSFDYNHFEADIRLYQTLDSTTRQVLAIQAFAEIMRGYPPPYRMPALGGSNLMRGYTSGSLRGARYFAGQAEYRAHIWRRLGAVAFAGLGEIENEYSDFRWRDLNYSYGAGLRFLFNKKENINLRADLGYGKNTDGIYFGIEEAF